MNQSELGQLIINHLWLHDFDFFATDSLKSEPCNFVIFYAWLSLCRVISLHVFTRQTDSPLVNQGRPACTVVFK